ncbi:MAG: bifunctional folylpolyglutamate synthase/dihydrofolate synthase [Mariprofundaceae bacterium]|nr:bifunctional folylpolyglutamate synthase/dihydrofolate synthase [Mariprofundaceae bacterium]
MAKKQKPPVETLLSRLGSPAADRDYRPGHQRVHALLAEMNLNRPRLRIRIAGTNGKGSTAFMLAHALQTAGLAVGIYTSPHIHTFNERIRINGQPVADTDIIPVLESMVATAIRIGASYFEVATALALSLFSMARVDVEILEAGVGARMDATTAIPADMALITPIALDHQAWLGETLAAIADEKAYAMQDCRWVISAPQADDVTEILLKHRPDIEFVSNEEGLPPLKMAGNHQHDNALLAYAAIRCLCGEGGVAADLRTMMRAIADTEVPGRLQHIRWNRGHIWLDAAHNMHAVQALLPSLPALADPFDAILVFTREDRDLTDVLPLLRPFTRRLVTQNNQAGCCDAHYDDLPDALEAEVTGRSDGSFLVLGSFTSVAAAEDWIMERGDLGKC